MTVKENSDNSFLLCRVSCEKFVIAHIWINNEERKIKANIIDDGMVHIKQVDVAMLYVIFAYEINPVFANTNVLHEKITAVGTHRPLRYSQRITYVDTRW